MALALAAFGCQGGGDDEEMPAPVATSVPFEGSPDASLAGAYKTADGRSDYTFSKDGSFKLKGKVSTSGGTFDNNVAGSWTINKEGQMLFKYGEGNVVPYKLDKTAKGFKLTLTGSMKRETELVKQ